MLLEEESVPGRVQAPAGDEGDPGQEPECGGRPSPSAETLEHQDPTRRQKQEVQPCGSRDPSQGRGDRATGRAGGEQPQRSKRPGLGALIGHGVLVPASH